MLILFVHESDIILKISSFMTNVEISTRFYQAYNLFVIHILHAQCIYNSRYKHL